MKHEHDILKWFNNELSEADITDLKQSDNLETLDKIAFYASQMRPPTVDAQQALDAFKERTLSKKETKVLPLNFKTFLRVAAILLVTIASSYFLFFNHSKSFETQLAQTKAVTLPDASEAILNAHSSLKFDKKNWNDQRHLELRGEAFFKVHKGGKFTVHTPVGTVQVLGTEFNVKERTDFFEVQCYEGLVAVHYQNKTWTLSKGKSFRVVQGTIQAVEDFNAETPSWLQAESNFDKIPLRQVLEEFERQYDLEVDYSAADSTQLFTGSFTHSDKHIALQSITIPLKLSYKIKGRNVTLYHYE